MPFSLASAFGKQAQTSIEALPLLNRSLAVQLMVAADVDHRLAEVLEGEVQTLEACTDIAGEDMNVAIDGRHIPLPTPFLKFEVHIADHVQLHGRFIPSCANVPISMIFAGSNAGFS